MATKKIKVKGRKVALPPRQKSRVMWNTKNQSEHHFLVTWEIDIYARTPEEAAAKALDIQRDTESTAKVFKVEFRGVCPGCGYMTVHTEKCRFNAKVMRSGNLLVDQPITVDLFKEHLELCPCSGCVTHRAMEESV